MAQKPKRWVLFQETGQDSKLEKFRKQAREAQGRVIRLQSMLNRIERLKLTEADFRDNQDFLRDSDIFMESDDRSLFEKACPVEFERIKRRERADIQEADREDKQEFSALLLKKLDGKLFT